MKSFCFLIIIFLFNSNSFSQKIPLKKLLSFYNKDVSNVENYLQENGYEFRNRQTSRLNQTATTYWDYNIQDNKHSVSIDLDTVRKITISISYNFYSKDEYLELLSTISKLKFNNTKPLKYRDDGTDKEFTRYDVNILISTTNYGLNKSLFQIYICKCSFSK